MIDFVKEYPEAIELRRVALLGAIQDRFEQITVGTMTPPEEIRAAVDLAMRDTSAKFRALADCEKYAKLTFIIRSAV
jgi:hypothetical protein